MLLREAAHCLMVKQFLRPAAVNFRMGYYLDTTSYPGDKALYVVDYTSKTQSEGYVYTVFVTSEDKQRTFNIQNNAKFIRSKKEVWGVRFTEDPLGGIWTQKHIAVAIKRIGRQQTFTLSLKSLSLVSPQCESYADPK